ncbi:MAG TPA: hypothetical protein PKH22_20285, partial [Leptospiraceae bacterium]|nr:hypothetical protein [Leptospiraceae bacterium]
MCEFFRSKIKFNKLIILRLTIIFLISQMLFCASAKRYVANRGNDLTDIIDIGLEKDVYGFNIITIVPFFGVSYNESGKGVGLRHSHIGFYKTGDPDNEFVIEDLYSKEKSTFSFNLGNSFFASTGFHESIDPRNLRTQNKNYVVVTLNKGCLKSKKSHYKGKTRYCHWNDNVAITPIEISLGLYFGFRAGFNVGKFVDFFGGIVGYDLIKDDYDENGNLPPIVSKDLEDNIIIPPTPTPEKKGWESKLDALD